jgi:hypothetical protein
MPAVEAPSTSSTNAHPAPSGVIVAGMHRSATSLTTAVFVARGWSAHGPLMGATRGNPRGHFEDQVVHQLHVDALAHYGANWDSAALLRGLSRGPLALDSVDSRVTKLVSSLAEQRPWVWKNPRATLFLDDWVRLLPHAHVVLCVRSPAAVADSLLRRGNRLGIRQGAPLVRLRRLARALSLWRSYNRAAHRFARRNRERVTVVCIPDDLDVLAGAAPDTFDPELLARRARLRVAVPAALAVRSQLLYRRLRRLANRDEFSALLAATPTGGQAWPGNNWRNSADASESSVPAGSNNRAEPQRLRPSTRSRDASKRSSVSSGVTRR